MSLSLESAFQLADMETPSIGAVGAEVGGASSQLNPVTTAVAEGGGAPISGGPEGTVSSRAGSPEPGVSAPSSGSEGYGASATAADLSEEGASGEAEVEVAASDASGAVESSSAEASRSESADAGDGGDEDDGTSASGETEVGESAEGESAAAEAAGEERAVGGDDGEGPSEKLRAPSAAVAVKRVDARRASQNLARGDAQATSRTLQGLNLPDLRGRRTPTPAAIANSLQQVRQRVVSGAGPR